MLLRLISCGYCLLFGLWVRWLYCRLVSLLLLMWLLFWFAVGFGVVWFGLRCGGFVVCGCLSDIVGLTLLCCVCL